MESLRNVTNSKARAILKRTNLIGTQCKCVLHLPYLFFFFLLKFYFENFELNFNATSFFVGIFFNCLNLALIV